MRVAIVGAGGVGGLLAALLSRAGEDVAVVSRGATLDALRARGLALDSPLGRFTCRPDAAEDPAALGVADAVLVAVKAWQVAELAPRLRPLVGSETVVVPLQNGVEAPERLAAALGSAVAGATIHVLAWQVGPAQVRHGGYPPRVTLGARGQAALAPRLARLADALQRAGVGAKVVEDVDRALWEKLMLVEPWGAVGAAARAPVGVLCSVAPTRALLRGAIGEVGAVARARGVALPEGVEDATLAALEAITPEATVSMQRDLGQGLRSELDDQTGAVVRLAGPAGVPVPIHAALHAALAPQAWAAFGRIPAFPRT
ncbi:MAG: 2-dehydropantoate 2-reductase [Anaeromyxobacter sp.]